MLDYNKLNSSDMVLLNAVISNQQLLAYIYAAYPQSFSMIGCHVCSQQILHENPFKRLFLF